MPNSQFPIPMNPESLTKMAEAYCLQGKLKEAIAACQQAIRVNPNFAPAYNALGNILQANSQIEAAMRAYGRSLQLSPNFFPAWANLGRLQDRQGYLDEAIASYERAIAIAPHEAGVWEYLGKVRCDRGDLEEAIACFRNLISLQPNNYSFWEQCGDLLQLNDELDEAFACYRRSLELKADDAETYVKIVTALAQKGKLIDAISWCQKALTIYPELALGIPGAGVGSGGQKTTVGATASQGQPLLIADNFEAGCFAPQLRDLGTGGAGEQPYALRAGFAYGFVQGPGSRGQKTTVGATASQGQPLLIADNFEAGCFAPQLEDSETGQDSELKPQNSKLTIIPNAQCPMPNAQCPIYKIHPEREFPLVPPQVISEELSAKLPKPLRREEGKSPPGFVAVIPNGRAWGDRFNSVVITADNSLVAELCTGFGKVPLFFCLEEPPPVSQIDGTVAFLSVQSGADFYYHWLVDVLPRWELLRCSGFLDEIDIFVLNDNSKKFQQETLAALGIPAHKIITSKTHPHIQARRLIVPSVPSTAPKWAGDFVYGPPRWVCDFLRTQFLPTAPLSKGGKSQPTAPLSKGGWGDRTDLPQRLYIPRHGAKHRRVINETEVIEFLDNFGFSSVTLEFLSVPEQAALLANARIVVAPHGGGLTNLIFCNPGTKVIEICSPRYVLSCYWVISNHLGLDYYYLEGQRLANSRTDSEVIAPRNIPRYSLYEDIVIDLDALSALLSKVIN